MIQFMIKRIMKDGFKTLADDIANDVVFI